MNNMTIHWIYEFHKVVPSEVVYLIAAHVGGYFPFPSPQKQRILQRHFQKRYCKTCGEYIRFDEIHRHYSRQKYFRYTPNFKKYLRVHELLYISKTNYKTTPNTPYDLIVIWQNTRAFYFSFRRCLNADRCVKLQSFRDVYFTDIGISSSACFWYLDEWNRMYPKMQYLDEIGFQFFEKDILWTPSLNPI